MATKMKLSAAVDEYLDHLVVKERKAPATVKRYRELLALLLRECGDVYIHNITESMMGAWWRRRSWGEATHNNARAALSRFFTHCRHRKWMYKDSDPLYGIAYMKVPKNQPHLRVPVQEWPRLFAACNHPTERVALGIGLFVFTRASEMSLIQWKHIDFHNATIDIYRQKTKQYDTMPVPAELMTLLREYKAWFTQTLAEAGEAFSEEHFVVVARRRGSASFGPDGKYLAGTGKIVPTRAHSTPRLLVKRVLERAGYPVVDQREGVHTLRRSGARAYFDSLVERGYDGALRRVMVMLGHANSAMTEHYLGLDLDKAMRNQDLAGKPMFDGLDISTERGLTAATSTVTGLGDRSNEWRRTG